MAEEMVLSEGGIVDKTQVTIKVDGVKAKVDLVADFDGKTVLIEVKNGPFARFTKNQSIVYPKISSSISELPQGMSIREFLSLQNSVHPNIPIHPVGQNAAYVWPNAQSVSNYSFIVIHF